MLICNVPHVSLIVVSYAQLSFYNIHVGLSLKYLTLTLKSGVVRSTYNNKVTILEL